MTFKRESWVWNDADPLDKNGRAFNGNWIPVLGAFVFIVATCLVTLVN